MIRIETEKLLELLGDLAHTAGGIGATAGILLHSARGYLGEDPGETDLLVGTSTTGRTVGHTYVPAYGQMPAPMLWPAADAAAVVAAFRPKLKVNKEHQLEIRHSGSTFTVTEDPHLFGDGLKVEFTEGQIGRYPRNLWDHLRDVPMLLDDWGPALPRTDVSPAALEPFIKVAKARKDSLQLYRYHQRGRVLVQIGHHYTGLLVSDQDWDVAHDGTAPDADVYAPELPEPDEDQPR